MEENEALLNPIIARARNFLLPEKLGLNDIAHLLFHHRKEAAPNEIKRLDEVLAEGNFIHWINNQIEDGLIPIEGRTNRKLPLWFRNNVFEPVLSKGEIKKCLDILELFPLEEGCLLSNWWPDSETANTDSKITDEEKVQAIGKRLLHKYGVDLATANAKKCPDLKPFYNKYPGKDPVIVDKWLCDIGVRKSTRGATPKAERELIPTLGNDCL